MDERAVIHERVLRTVRNIYDETLKTDDYRERMEIKKHAKLSESMRRREAFVRAASVIKVLNITSDDPNPWLLNMKNGTIDVTIGEFRKHRQEDMITKIAKVDIIP
jgi:putative DNA primase/helicase